MNIEELKERLTEQRAERETTRVRDKQKRDLLATEVESLCCDLENILAKKTQTPALLLRQAHILDRLFLHYAQELVQKESGGESALAATTLRAQEQCVTTLKARAAIPYMNALMKNSAKENELLVLPHPLPPETVRSETE